MQTPVRADYASRLEAMLVDVTRERIDFRRPSWVIVRVGSEMGKIFGAVMDVHNKKTNCRGTKKESTKDAEIFRSELRVYRFPKKSERQERQWENH